MSNFIADFHIHSKFSMATSKKLTPEWLDLWARAKGIGVVGTGDFTHPEWLELIKEQIYESDNGLFSLKKKLVLKEDWVQNGTTRFMLTAEISSIYKRNGKTRKVHNIIWAPSFEIAEKIQYEFKKRNFNITYDGRPIIGLDSRDLFDMCLSVSEDIVLVPAHIWTPWFSVLGAKSGFDSIEECYGDLTPHIFAVESGLSSDSPMNRMISKLDSFAVLSNSDAHSPEKLGRNANILNCELDYYSIIDAIKNSRGEKFIGTIDMFPQEGKYHYSGHRKCNVCLNPVEVLEHNFICPACNKPITLGVLDRVFQLSDKSDISECMNWQQTKYIIPLPEILSEMFQVGQNTKKITFEYQKIITVCKSELNLLLYMPINEINDAYNPMLGEGIRRMRNGDVFVSEGFDGEYGTVKMFTNHEVESFLKDNTFTPGQFIKKDKRRFNFDLHEFQKLAKNADFSIVSGKKPDTQLRLF